MKKYVLIGSLLAVLALLGGCQQVFTYSVFEELGWQRDVSTLPPEQKIAYGESALASGDTTAMEEAYNALGDLLAATTAADDPELYTLAAELAIGASGLMDTLTGALAALEEETVDIEALFEALDTDLLSDAVDLVEALDAAEADISPDLYVNAAAALLIVTVDEAGGFENIDWENPSTDLEQAVDWALEGGVDLEALMGGL
ncbi:MAG: hypothetical protein JW760_07260 [Spirochaetales bacterium]|nr:hypothetical protein [Spirochaetales bacterium]